MAIEDLYLESGVLIEAGHLKETIELIFAYIRRANKYFDKQKPWAQFKEDRIACLYPLNTCIQFFANLANLLNPFVPFSCEKIRKFLTLEQPTWKKISGSGWSTNT